MARQLSDEETALAPSTFIPIDDQDNRVLSYHCELITPMAGGGTKSWQPDLKNPVRSQAVKGQLRFWWRTMQNFKTAKELKEAEDKIWGSTNSAGVVRLQVDNTVKLTKEDMVEIEKNEKGILQFDKDQLPGYVLFPLQGQKDLPSYTLIKNLQFDLKFFVSDPAIADEISKTIKLWLLFGGLGARTTRGCGSIYCQEVMAELHTGEEINTFINNVSPANPPEPHTSPYPMLANCKFSFSVNQNTSNPVTEWNSLLTSYGNFRQGKGVGRNQGQGNRPGRTRWPEADAIRRITNRASADHTPEHPAGQWFPRGAYGLPIQSEFKNATGDPDGKFFLQPEGEERWPSPVFLKIVKLNDSSIAKICLILNHAIPESLALVNDKSKIHTLLPEESPLSYVGKTMPDNANMLHSGENPYDALIRHLNLTEVN